MSPGAAIAGPGRTLGEAELVELRALFAASESADVIAASFSVDVRTVERWKVEVRRDGGTVRVSEDVGNENNGAMDRMCERCAERRAVVTVGAWDVCDRCEPKERAKQEKPVRPPFTIDGPITPLDPTQQFMCAKYMCTLLSRACVERQTALRKRPAQATDQTPRPVYEYCASGECQQGALIKLRVHAWGGRPVGNKILPTAFRNQVAPTAKPSPAPLKPSLPVPVEQRRAEIAAAVDQQQEEHGFDEWMKKKNDDRDRKAAMAMKLSPTEIAEEVRVHGSVKKAASALGIAPQTIYNRLEALDPEDKPLRKTDGATGHRHADLTPAAALKVVKKHGGIRKAEKATGISRNTLHKRLADGGLRDAALNAQKPPAAPPEKAEQSMAITDDKVRAAHEKHGGNINAVAVELGIAWGTARKHIQRLGLDKAKATPAAKLEGKPRAVAKPKSDEQFPQPERPVAGAAAETRTRVELPAIKDLPVEYLLLCVEYARQMQQRFETVLGTSNSAHEAA